MLDFHKHSVLYSHILALNLIMLLTSFSIPWPGDDAAVYKVNEECALVATLDFFTPIVDDPYQFGQIACANSLSDVYAMGYVLLLARVWVWVCVCICACVRVRACIIKKTGCSLTHND